MIEVLSDPSRQPELWLRASRDRDAGRPIDWDAVLRCAADAPAAAAVAEAAAAAIAAPAAAAAGGGDAPGAAKAKAAAPASSNSYSAAVDWPACAFYKELMERYPGAKVGGRRRVLWACVRLCVCRGGGGMGGGQGARGALPGRKGGWAE